ncbi:MAG: DUF2231 domain-containing protein [Chloroflexaceae bacterium]|nr:DUF2231 domain-containing protein [Chloroflexaceae bacterium]
MANGLFTLLYLRHKERSFEQTAYHCLIVGWFGSLVALVSGTIDAARQLIGPDAPRDNALLTWVNAHAATGIATAIVYGQALLRRRRNPTILDDATLRGGYLRLLVVGALLVVVGGWLGGHLVYELGLGS